MTTFIITMLILTCILFITTLVLYIQMIKLRKQIIQEVHELGPDYGTFIPHLSHTRFIILFIGCIIMILAYISLLLQ